MVRHFSQQFMQETTKIFCNVFSNSPFNFEFINENIAESYFIDMINSPNSICFCYFENNKLVGACFGSTSSCSPVKIYEIKEIFVDKFLQNKGIGSKFLSEVEAILKEENVSAIKLSTMKNINAYDFYLKNNYKVIEDSVTMFKPL